jgi:hypothetical protein
MEVNTKMDLREIKSESVDWIHLAHPCEDGNEPSGSIKGGEFLDYLSEYQLFKEDYAPWS